MEYDDKAPWPICADGNGASLELILYDSDNTLPESWQCGLIHGSPGSENGSGDLNTSNIVINEINYNSSDNFLLDILLTLVTIDSTLKIIFLGTVETTSAVFVSFPYFIQKSTF